MKGKKETKRLAERLFSANDGEVLTVIREIRERGDPSLIEALLKVYDTTSSPGVIHAVAGVIRDMKSQAAVEKLFPALQNISDPERRRELIAACWQSGLDFSRYIGTFLEIFTEADYLTALEAFSVIENALPFLNDRGTLERHLAFLKERVPPSDDPRHSLFGALIRLFEDHLQGQWDQ